MKVGMISKVALVEISRPVVSRTQGSRTPVFLPSAEPNDLKGLIGIFFKKGNLSLMCLKMYWKKSETHFFETKTGAMHDDALFGMLGFMIPRIHW